MKILHYINNLGSGGAEKLLTEILPLMKEYGHDVHLVYANNKANAKNYHSALSNAGIKIKNLDVSFYNPVQIFLLVQLIKKGRYDIVHAHLFPSQYWLAVASFFKPKKTKLVKTEHNVFNHRRKYPVLSIIEKYVYSRYSKIIAITDEVKSGLVSWLKNENKISVINNGINLQLPNNSFGKTKLTGYAYVDKDTINILMTARFNGIAKDQNTLIRAMKLLPENYHVYFAGEGALLDNSQKLAKDLNIESRVHFLGMRTDARSLMEKADVNVLSTNYEGLPGAALEALASGKPFIGSDVPGINNIVPDNRFLFPAKNQEKLAQKIKEITANKMLACEMITIATEHVKKFDIRLMVESYLNLYAGLFQKKHLVSLQKIKIKNLLVFLFTLIFTGNLVEKGHGQEKVYVNVKDFGAVGDGKKDDYAALLKVVEYINGKGTGEVYFPAGNYFIAAFRNGQNNVKDLQFTNCDSLLIHGSNAVISVNGNFNRAVTMVDGNHKRSNITAIVPLKIDHCKNVTIENLEIDGNVDQMTRDAGVVEAASHLLLISESQNVILNNLFLHHSQTDGIYIRGRSTKKITAKSITSSNNARQGMSIIELTDASFTSCKFINTGITEGKYARHAPGAGVDIEPHGKRGSVNNIHFESCLFQNNLGSQFVCSAPATSKNIFLNNCVFNSRVNSSRYSIIVNASNVIFQGCNFDCKNGSIYPVWHKDSSSSIFKRCNIKSNSSGFVAVNNLKNSKVIIDSCNLEYTGAEKIKSFFPYIRMRNLLFTNNVVQIPRQHYKNTGTTILIESADKSGTIFQSN